MRCCSGLLVLATSSSAFAEEATSSLWVGAQLDLLPSGSLHVEVNDQRASVDTDGAFGLGGLADYRINSNFAIGFAPRFIVPVKAENASDSGRQLDLRLRATAGKDVAPRVHLHGIATAGYSLMFHVLQNLDTGEYERTQGLIIGFGAGIGYAISEKLQLVGELSYQIGYQGTTIEGIGEVDAGDSYLTLGVGLVTPI